MAKNFEDISCIFCGEKNDVTSDHCVACSESLHVGKDFEGKFIENYTLLEYKARGYYGLTYKAVDNYQKTYAIKLISRNSYLRHGKDFDEEAKMYANLPATPSIVTYIGADSTSLTYKDREVQFFYIACEWINGQTFKEFIASTKLTPEDLIVAAKDLLLGLQELHENNLWHNDLHDENIMIEPINQTQMRRFGRSIPRIYKIIDVGSMVYRNPSDVKLLRDMNCTGNLLFQISDKLKINFDEYSKEDQYFVNLSDSAIMQMTDENPSRSFSDPISSFNKIEELYGHSRLGIIAIRKELDGPYGYINANDIPSPWLLKHMFSDKLPYFSKIISTSEQCLLITGPRGCGKTMILKNMRFTTMYDAQEEGKENFLDKLPYIGLFVSARTNFGNYLVSFRPQEWIEDDAKVLYYFNTLVSIELVDILYRLFFDKLATEEQIKPVIDMMSVRFSAPHVNLLTIKAMLVQSGRKLIANEDVQIHTDNSTPAYLNDLIKIFKMAIPCVGGGEKELILEEPKAALMEPGWNL